MNVKELRKILKHFPSDCEIRVPITEHADFTIDDIRMTTSSEVTLYVMEL